jgi:hypothetical protein
MKRLIMAFLFFIGLGVGLSQADFIGGVPQGPAGALATADYGGVEISTVSFSSATQTIAIASTGVYIVVHGVNFSSGNVTDFIVLRDSAGLSDVGNANSTQESLRLFNVYASTQGIGATGTSAGPVWLQYPAIFKKGVLWNVSSTAYNVVTLFYHKRRTP